MSETTMQMTEGAAAINERFYFSCCNDIGRMGWARDKGFTYEVQFIAPTTFQHVAYYNDLASAIAHVRRVAETLRDGEGYRVMGGAMSARYGLYRRYDGVEVFGEFAGWSVQS